MLPRRAGACAGRHPEREHAAGGGPGAGRSVPARVGSTSAARQGRPGDPGRVTSRPARSPPAGSAVSAAEKPHTSRSPSSTRCRGGQKQLDRLGQGDRHERGRVPTVRARRADCRRVTTSGSRVSYGKTAARHQRRPASASRARLRAPPPTTVYPVWQTAAKSPGGAARPPHTNVAARRRSRRTPTHTDADRHGRKRCQASVSIRSGIPSGTWTG